MTFDSRIRNGVVLPRSTVGTTPTPTKATKPATRKPTGFSTDSSFDASPRVADKAAQGRAKKGGVQDDSIGRAKKGGVQDDSIGRAKKGGVQDDSIGRAKKGGVQDDSIGRAGAFDAVRDALVGPASNPDHVALRNALFDRLENPSFAYDIPKGAAGAKDLLRDGITKLAASLPAAAKEQLTTVMSRLDEEGLRLLGAALEKSPKLLSDVDSKGGTVLANLARLATQPLNAKLAGDTTSGTVLRGVLRDIVNPNRIDQGTAPTCTVTSIQFELAADEPAEYTRIMADLCGPAGKAKMRGGGELQIESGDAARAARDLRSASQAIFQTAAMEYANGKFLDFDPVSGRSTDTRTGETYVGIKPSQLANLLSKLFGVTYSTDNLKDEKEGAKVLETLRGFDARGARNRPIILHIDQGDYNHAVTLERVTDGRVQYRDPYGVLRSMPEALFAKYVMTVQRPVDTRVP
jgi:hypothetical protein